MVTNGSISDRSGSTDGPTGVSAATGLPPLPDVALGLGSVLAETGWRCGSIGLAWATSASVWALATVRSITPQAATTRADARLLALAARGQRVRRDRAAALSETVTTAVTSAVTSDTMREMTVSAIDRATDEVLAVVMPAVLAAVADEATQAQLDELLAGLLMRQLPSALEKTLPGVMLRTATRPALGFVPSLMGAITSGRSQ
jgi:hypothetical protein